MNYKLCTEVIQLVEIRAIRSQVGKHIEESKSNPTKSLNEANKNARETGKSELEKNFHRYKTEEIIAYELITEKKRSP